MMPAPPSLVRLAGNNMGRLLLGPLILPVLWEMGRKEEEKAGRSGGRKVTVVTAQVEGDGCCGNEKGKGLTDEIVNGALEVNMKLNCFL